MGSLGLGSDVLSFRPKHLEASRQYLLFTMYAEQASGVSPDANFYFFKRQTIRQFNTNRIGGAERDRTADPLLAKQVLSQLSYSPISSIAPNISVQGFGKLPRQVISFPTLIPSREWWAREDLNFRPHAYQACALTN